MQEVDECFHLGLESSPAHTVFSRFPDLVTILHFLIFTLCPLSGAQAVLSSFAKPPFGVFHENLEIIFDKAGVCMSLGAGWSRDRGRGAA